MDVQKSGKINVVHVLIIKSVIFFFLNGSIMLQSLNLAPPCHIKWQNTINPTTTDDRVKK